MANSGSCTYAGGCDEPIYCREYCQRHYDRLRKSGELALVQERVFAEGTCIGPRSDTELCGRELYNHKLLLCNAHNQQRLKNKPLTPINSHRVPEGTKCCLSICTDLYYSAYKGNHYCRYHYDQAKANRPFTPRPVPYGSGGECSVSDCRRPKDDEGLCTSHWLMRWEGDALIPLVLKVEATENRAMLKRGISFCCLCQKELPVEDFTWDSARNLPRSRCRFCIGVDLRARKHNRKLSEIYRLFDFQKNTCALCGEPHNEGLGKGLHLDHSHDHCPTKGESCGKCIRGLLCWLCNGGFVAAYEKMRGRVEPYPLLENYLDKPPALQLGLVMTTF